MISRLDEFIHLLTLNMAEIPLILKIKKESHKKIAKAQDLIVETLYEVFDNAVIHGGTAIWRCYEGNRFSEDVDVYIPKNLEKIELLFEAFKKNGFFIEKKKISENSIYSNLRLDDTYVRFEALFKKVSGQLKEYETADGNYITVYTLSPEQFVAEKIDTYLNRKKIRDLYDIFFLLRYVNKNQAIKDKIKKFVSNLKKPVDESDLRVLIFEGLVPETEKMIKYIQVWS